MLRATTPTHTFNFCKLDPSTFTQLNAYYAQRGRVLIEKHKEDFTIESETIEEETFYHARITLTQEETKLFVPNTDVEIQLRVLTADNASMATPKYRVPVHDVLDDEVLENET